MVVGWKAVCKGIPINKFFGLKLKINSILSDDGKESVYFILFLFLPNTDISKY